MSKYYQNYIDEFTIALKKKASVKRNTNVLQHLAGYLKKNINSEDKSVPLAVEKAIP